MSHRELPTTIQKINAWRVGAREYKKQRVHPTKHGHTYLLLLQLLCLQDQLLLFHLQPQFFRLKQNQIRNDRKQTKLRFTQNDTVFLLRRNRYNHVHCSSHIYMGISWLRAGLLKGAVGFACSCEGGVSIKITIYRGAQEQQRGLPLPPEDRSFTARGNVTHASLSEVSKSSIKGWVVGRVCLNPRLWGGAQECQLVPNIRHGKATPHLRTHSAASSRRG